MDHLTERNIDLKVRDGRGRTTFLNPCISGHKDVIKYQIKLILDHSNIKIDLNVTDNSGWTAFAFACNVGHTDVVKLVLNNSTNRNIDLNVRDKRGRTALFLLYFHKTSLDLLSFWTMTNNFAENEPILS